MNINKLNHALINSNILKMVHIDIDPITMKYNVLFSLSDNEDVVDEVSFYFYDVSNMRMEDIGGGLTQFMHLKISVIDVSNDRNKYKLEDVEDSKISFEFNSVDLLK
ncbi:MULTISPECIES: hypothetical protein [Citrobacter]|uniref:hypothetical protein n=1 Tax=Citrobacter TaxID=544 RepID=UPI000502FB5C|nr:MULTISPECIES: hypothetical protein [Citrobacter]GAS71268.1 hypothetical protein NGUA40_00859 [Salmonella enterica]MDN8551212.1 hypothetical protein [Citrobacter werkmanii]MDN8555862.1 hypothetical protein [Citrobacter werkmanii]TKU75788.1 hypothetical protein FDW92_08150 [Citrobacter sp. wls706]UCA26560.1 hypothetical protein LA356_07530 [Citrobacter werkmanii]